MNIKKFILSSFVLFASAISCFSCEAKEEPSQPEHKNLADLQLQKIEVTKTPDKTSYVEGEYLDITGIEVTAFFSENTSAIVSNYTYDLKEALLPEYKTVTVSYTHNSITKIDTFEITVSKSPLESITVDHMPNKMTYIEGEEFDSTGIVVTAHYANGANKIITDYQINAPQTITSSNKTISISYKEGDVTKTASFSVYLNTAKYVYTPHLNDVLPIIKINTPSGTDWVTKYNRNSKLAGLINYVDATITTEGGVKSDYNFSNAKAQVKVRGNYTLDYEKKPIRIKFEEKHIMFGMNNNFKAKSWCLLAEWKDLSMLNNSVTLYMGHAILGNDGYYNSDFMYTDVYINEQYWGVYLLAEQQEVKSKRFNITEADETKPDDLNIGYLVEYDSSCIYEPEETVFHVDFSSITFKDADGKTINSVKNGFTIKSDIYSDAQRTQIKNYITNCLKIIYNAVTNNKYYKMSEDYSTLVATTETDPYKVISRYVDMTALIDYFIIEEIVKDPDLQLASFYMDCDLNKDSFKPLTLEGLWDFDSALGIRNGWTSTDGIYSFYETEDGMNPFFALFSRSDWFLKLVKEKWDILLESNVFNDALDFAETCKNKYKDKYEQNYDKWTSRITEGNFEVVSQVNVNHTEADGADYLISWMTKRLKAISPLLSGKDFKTNKEMQNNKSLEELLKNKQKYRFEAENGTVKGCKVKTDVAASGGKYLSEVAGATGRGFSCSFTSSSATDEAIIFITCSKREMSGNLCDWFTIFVNNIEYPIDESVIVPQISNGETTWHTWVSFYGCVIKLKQGSNTLDVLTNSTTSTNLDCVDIYSSSMLV